MAKPDTTQLKNLLDPTRQIAILLPQNPHYDAVAAGLGFKLSLESTGKSSFVVCPDPMTVEFNRLVGVDTVASTFGNRNLVIAFPGQTEHVDKVSYNLDKGELHLVISPKPDSPDLDHRRLKFVPGSAQTDLIFLLGINQLSDLGPLYNDVKNILTSSQVVSVTHSLPAENYTPHQFFDPEASSLSELMFHIIESLSLHLPADVASNLLAGLEKATDSFQSPQASPLTFETAAQLIRRGARRQQPLSAANFPPGSIPTQPYTPPPPAPAPSQPSPALSGWGTDSQPHLQSQPGSETQSPAKKPPSDWYEPKIYRGPMLP